MSIVCWRIARAVYADLSGTGALITGGRWNSPGRPVVYTAADASLAVLEVRVHLDLPPDLLPDDYVLMRIEAATPPDIERVDVSPSDTRAFGDAWLASGRSAVLDVPSAIVPESRNILINPTHPDARAFAIASMRPFGFDSRLWLDA
jgi:RES domain-containing protein